MKTAKNAALQHVPIKLEPADEQEQLPTPPRIVAGAVATDSDTTVKLNKKKSSTKANAADSEQDTDDDDEWDEEESEIEEEDVLDEDETLQISSDEEAELEAQRIRFHELLAKSLIGSGGSAAGATLAGSGNGSVARSSGPSNVESGASANITPNSSRGSSMAPGAQLQGSTNAEHRAAPTKIAKARHTSTKSAAPAAKKPKKSKIATIFKRKPHSKHYKMQQKQLLVQKKLKQTQRQCAEQIRLMQQRKALKQQEQELLEKARAAQTIIEQAAANEERRSSVCSVNSSIVSSASQTEGCGCFLIYDNQDKLIFNCGLCDARYALKSSYIKHLSLSHKLIDEENIELQDTPADIDIKRETLSEDQAMPAPHSSVNQELCGNIFILQRKNLFVRCAYCDCRYANFEIFQKHLRQQHHLLQQADPGADKNTQQTATQQQPSIARVPLQQQVTPQQQQQLATAQPLTVVEVPVKDVVASIEAGLPTKKEIKTEIFIITELPTESAPSVGGSAGGTPLRGSPSCESTRSSNSDQPMVTIPQENGIQIELQQDLLRFELSKVAAAVGGEPNSELQMTATDVPAQQTADVNINNVTEDDDVKENQLLIVAQQKQEPSPNDMEQEAKEAGALVATRAMTDGYESPVKQTAASKATAARKRKLKEKNVLVSEKKSKKQSKKSLESLPKTPETTPIEQPAEQVNTGKKRGRPKRINIEQTVSSSNTPLVSPTEPPPPLVVEAAEEETPQKGKVRNKRQRKTKTPAKPKAVKTTTTESSTATQQTPQSIVQSNSVLSGVSEDTKQPLNEFQHSVDELFKKLTESPKAAKVAWAARMQNDELYGSERHIRDSVKQNNTTMSQKDLETPSLSVGTPSSIQHGGSISPETASKLLLNLDSKDNIQPAKDITKVRVIKSAKNQYTCEFCSKTFTKQSRCLEHTRIHTGEKPFRCEICSREFRLKMRLNEHKLRHRIERAYKCDVCGLALATKQDLQQHMRHHNGDRRFQCPQCPKAFVRGSDLKIHERVHTGEKPFTCEICNKKFRANQNLTVHRRSHTLEKNFPCEVCDKRFMRKVDRKVHMRTHTGEKPFKCEICQRGYSSRVHVRAHLEREHVLAPCGLKPERKKSGPKQKQQQQQQLKLELENGHSQSELADMQATVAMVLGEHEVKAEKLDSQDGQRLVQVLAIDDPDCKLPESNHVEEVLEEPPVLTVPPKASTGRKQKQQAAVAPTTAAPRRGRKLAVANTNTTNDLSDTTTALKRSAKSATATKPPAATTTPPPPPQQVSVTVSMQLENADADRIIDDEDVDVDDNDVDDEAMPEKENDNSILSAAGVGVVAVAVNASAVVATNGANNTPLKAHVKNERSKITSYFTVVGQKSEL